MWRVGITCAFSASSGRRIANGPVMAPASTRFWLDLNNIDEVFVNRSLTLALVASAFVATPALAQDTAAAAAHDFTGPRVGVNVGFADDSIFGTEAFTYGADVGYDIAAGGAVLGITAKIEDSKDIKRELALTARAGARVGNSGLLYVAGGYSNIRVFGVNVDGYRLAVGGELGLGQNAYVKLEQRYGNYQYGLDLYQTMIGAGFRF